LKCIQHFRMLRRVGEFMQTRVSEILQNGSDYDNFNTSDKYEKFRSPAQKFSAHRAERRHELVLGHQLAQRVVQCDEFGLKGVISTQQTERLGTLFSTNISSAYFSLLLHTHHAPEGQVVAECGV